VSHLQHNLAAAELDIPQDAMDKLNQLAG